jgi:hypothetical protein
MPGFVRHFKVVGVSRPSQRKRGGLPRLLCEGSECECIFAYFFCILRIDGL